MNRTDLVNQVAEAIGGDKKAARVAVDTVFDGITRALVEGDRVHLTGVGTFQAEVVPSRFVRNPATGKKVRAKKTARVRFRPSITLKEYVAGRKRLPRRKAG